MERKLRRHIISGNSHNLISCFASRTVDSTQVMYETCKKRNAARADPIRSDNLHFIACRKPFTKGKYKLPCMYLCEDGFQIWKLRYIRNKHLFGCMLCRVPSLASIREPGRGPGTHSGFSNNRAARSKLSSAGGREPICLAAE